MDELASEGRAGGPESPGLLSGFVACPRHGPATPPRRLLAGGCAKAPKRLPMHTAGAEKGHVFLATIAGSVYAVSAADGKQVWRWNNGRRTGYSAAVLLADGKVFIGGRGGDFHAPDQATGKEVWSYSVPAPIYQTAAYNEGQVYFAAEDMHCYCLAAADGKQVWKSRNLGGMSFRDYHPVVYRGRILLESQPAFGEKWVDTFSLGAWPPKEKLDPWLAKHGVELRQGKLAPETL